MTKTIKNHGDLEAELAADTFCWEEDDDEFEVVLGMETKAEKKGETGWKRAGDEKRCRGTKKGKTIGLVDLDTSDHTKKKTTKEKMQERGEIVMDSKTMLQTDIQVEWNMTDNCKQFNIRAALVNIMEKNQMVDNKTYIKSSITNHIWKELTVIPTGEAFNKAFDGQQAQTGNKLPKVRMYITIFLT
eukprot:9417680-Ditylum_brightwellii.AAC.1